MAISMPSWFKSLPTTPPVEPPPELKVDGVDGFIYAPFDAGMTKDKKSGLYLDPNTVMDEMITWKLLSFKYAANWYLGPPAEPQPAEAFPLTTFDKEFLPSIGVQSW